MLQNAMVPFEIVTIHHGGDAQPPGAGTRVNRVIVFHVLRDASTGNHCNDLMPVLASHLREARD